MTLTDYVPAVLENLRHSVALNEASAASATETGAAIPAARAAGFPSTRDVSAAGTAGEIAVSGHGTREGCREAAGQLADLGLGSQSDDEINPELWDPEDADSCEDLDSMLRGPDPAVPHDGRGAAEAAKEAPTRGETTAWDYVSC